MRLIIEHSNDNINEERKQKRQQQQQKKPFWNLYKRTKNSHFDL